MRVNERGGSDEFPWAPNGAPSPHGDAVRLLQIIRRDLAELVLPDVRSDRVRFIGSLITRLLDIVRGQIANPGLAVEEWAIAAAIARTLPRDHTTAQGSSSSSLAGPLRDIEDFVDPLRNDCEPPASLWRDLVRLTEASDMAKMGGVTASLDDSFKESGSGRRGGTGDEKAAARPQPITAVALASYLRDRHPELGVARVAEVSQLATGFSKDTLLVTVETGRGSEKWVLRRDASVASLGSSVVHEFPLLATIHRAGLPAPEPLWVEPDSDIFGAATLATKRLAGSADVAAWIGDPEKARGIVRQAAVLLARLHEIDPELLPPSKATVAGTVGANPKEQAAHLFAYWREMRSEPSPGSEAAFGWLLRRAPDRFSKRAIVHADFGFHNLLVDGDRITGLLDWEFTHIGDPLEDLAWLRPFVEPLAPWSEFIATYRDAGGVAGDPEIERFYAVFNSLRISVGCLAYVRALRAADPRLDSKQIYVGWCYARRYIINAIELIEAER